MNLKRSQHINGMPSHIETVLDMNDKTITISAENGPRVLSINPDATYITRIIYESEERKKLGLKLGDRVEVQEQDYFRPPKLYPI